MIAIVLTATLVALSFAAVAAATVVVMHLPQLFTAATEFVELLAAVERKRFAERAAADIVLGIEEQVATMRVSEPDAVLTADIKAKMFLAAAKRDDALDYLDDAELLNLLHATLPKLSLGAFADTRGRSVEVRK